MFGRRKIAAFIAEFLGAATLTLITFAISRSGVGFPFFIATGIGITIAGLILMFGGTSVGFYNPAVTIGLWTTRRIKTITAIGYLIAQFLGALSALRLFKYLNADPIKSIGGSGLDWKIVVAEAIGTLLLTMGVATALSRGFDGLKTAVSVGLALFIGINIASIASNGIINPAVALGVQSWSRSYVLGPLVGGLIGANLYELLYVPINIKNQKRRDDESNTVIETEVKEVTLTAVPKVSSVRPSRRTAKSAIGVTKVVKSTTTKSKRKKNN